MYVQALPLAWRCRKWDTWRATHWRLCVKTRGQLLDYWEVTGKEVDALQTSVSHPNHLWFIARTPCRLSTGGSCAGTRWTTPASKGGDKSYISMQDVQAADKMQQSILISLHVLHLARWKQWEMNLFRQNLLAQFASGTGIEAPICSDGGKAYHWISVK